MKKLSVCKLAYNPKEKTITLDEETFKEIASLAYNYACHKVISEDAKEVCEKNDINFDGLMELVTDVSSAMASMVLGLLFHTKGAMQEIEDELDIEVGMCSCDDDIKTEGEVC